MIGPGVRERAASGQARVAARLPQVADKFGAKTTSASSFAVSWVKRLVRAQWSCGMAATATAAGALGGAWVVLSGGSALALAPAVAAVGAAVVFANRQVAAYVMLASLPFAEISVGHGISLVRYILILALITWFIGASVFESFTRLRLDRTDTKVIMWVVGSIASVAVFNFHNAPVLTQTYLNLVLVYYMASRVVASPRQARGAALAISVGVGVLALMTLTIPGLAGSVTASGGVLRQGPLGVSGAAGINRFAGWLAVGTLLPWIALDGRESRASTLVARGLSIASLVALVATASKAGLIAVGVGVLCWTALSPRGARIVRAVGASATLMAGWLLLPTGVHQRFSAFLQSNSLAYSRFAIWDAGLKMFLSHPFFGVGVGNFARFAPTYFPQGTPYEESQAAHNIVIGALAETGMVGILLLIVMVGSVLMEGIRMVRADRRVGSTGDAGGLHLLERGTAYARPTLGLVISYFVFLTVALSVDLERDRFFVVLAGLVHGLYRSRFRAAA